MADNYVQPIFQTSIDTSSVTGRAEEFRLEITPVTRPFSGRVAPGDRTVEDSGPIVDHASTYAARWNAHAKSYWGWFDEALRNSWENSLVMRRDGFIHQLLRCRQIPVASLPHSVECSDPDDKGQEQVAKQVESIFDHMRRFTNMKIQLLEADFYGKSASQIIFGRQNINGREWNTVVSHFPVQGDKLRYKWDGTPGVEIHPDSFNDLQKKYGKYIEKVDLAPVLFLKDEKLRDRFVIHEFEPSDTDYLYEGDMAGAIHGLGLRSRAYWNWETLVEIKTWLYDALQRVGINGMIYGFYKSGSAASKAAAMKALKDLVNNNIAVFETDAAFQGFKDIIQRIEPTQVGYDILFREIERQEQILRVMFLGQDLSTESAPTGLGSGVAALQGLTREGIIRYDADILSETLEDQLLKLILKYNRFEYNGRWYWGNELPFTLRFKLQTDTQNVLEKIQAAQTLYGMGVELDAEDLRDKAGLKAPKEGANMIVTPPDQQQGQPGQNGQQQPGRGVNDPLKSNQTPRLGGKLGGLGRRMPSLGNRQMTRMERSSAISEDETPERYILNLGERIKAATKKLPRLHPDYGHIFWNQYEGKVYVCTSDSDERETTRAWKEVLSSVDGVKEVRMESEYVPDEIREGLKTDNGWVKMDRYAEDPCGDGGAEGGFHKGNTCGAGGKGGKAGKTGKTKPAKSAEVATENEGKKGKIAASGSPKGKFRATRDMIPEHIRHLVDDSDLANFKTQKSLDAFIENFRKEDVLPSLKELIAFAEAGEAAKGQYEAAHRGLKAILGHEMANLYGALNAVLSAQTPWEEHTVGAIRLLRMWSEAGKPKNEEGINAVLDRFTSYTRINSSGDHVKAYSLWDKPKADKIRELLKHDDYMNIREDQISSNEASKKTREFFKANIDKDGVPLDAHMVKIMKPPIAIGAKNIQAIQKIAESGNLSVGKQLLDAQKKLIKNLPVYNSYKAKIKEAALRLGWSPTEVQESVWSTVAAFYVMKSIVNPDTGERFTTDEIIDNLTDITVGSAWTFANLVTEPEVANEFRRLGIPEGVIEDVRAGVEQRFGKGGGRPQRVRVRDRAALASGGRRIPADVGKASGKGMNIVLPSGEKISRFKGWHDEHPDDPGVYVMLPLSPAVAKGLAVEDGLPADELHVTVVYLGRRSELELDEIARARQICKEFAESHRPIPATLAGIRRFDNPDSTPAYVPVNSDELMNFHEELTSLFDLASVPYRQDYDAFTPHVTLTYLSEGESLPDPVETEFTSFRSVAFCVGKNKKEYKFEGELSHQLEGDLLFVS